MSVAPILPALICEIYSTSGPPGKGQLVAARKYVRLTEEHPRVASFLADDFRK